MIRSALIEQRSFVYIVLAIIDESLERWVIVLLMTCLIAYLVCESKSVLVGSALVSLIGVRILLVIVTLVAVTRVLVLLVVVSRIAFMVELVPTLCLVALYLITVRFGSLYLTLLG
jgi:hypothetical protein